MRTVRSVEALRAALAPQRAAARSIALVPTMGALHEGHLSLIRHARSSCDVVVVSLFVNPAQFNERADLERYPRGEQRDGELAQGAGADVLFAPPVEEVYPPGFASSVEVLGLGDRLEGAVRGREHFRGVCTVVTKLLCMALPDVAIFGQKDAQQVVIIRRLVSDLNLPVRIEARPTVREPDGLAMSSRNALLSPEQRMRARALPASLQAATSLLASGELSADSLVGAVRRQLRTRGVEPDYVALVEPDTLEALDVVAEGALLLLAARIGDVRLIDNVTLSPPLAAPTSASRPRAREVLA